MPEPTPKIFISYAWKNQAIAKRLQGDLKRDGVDVFVDYEKIAAGDSLPERISAALEWCNTLVLLWSADSAESYYVKQEWSSAFHLQKKIIACVLDDTKLPALLSGNLYLNFASYEAGYLELYQSLGVVLSKSKIGKSKTIRKHAFPKDRFCLNPNLIIERDERKLIITRNKWTLERRILFKARNKVEKYSFHVDWTGSIHDFKGECRDIDGVLSKSNLVSSKSMNIQLWELRFIKPLQKNAKREVFISWVFFDPKRIAKPYHAFGVSNVWSCKRIVSRLIFMNNLKPKGVYFVEGTARGVPLKKVEIKPNLKSSEYAIDTVPEAGKKYAIEWELYS